MTTLLRLSVLLCLSVLTACSARHDARLTAIDSVIVSNPRRAIAELSAIDPDSLSTPGRHYYDLLTIKADDKAYAVHSSDSLVLDVIDWFAHHDKSRYPEALYYGGRVYADLGNLPTALSYLHDALDELPSESSADSNIELRRNIVSQIGRLLENLSLPDQAIPYMEESLRLTEQLGGENLYYDHQQLGNAYSRKKDYLNAEPDGIFRLLNPISLTRFQITI